MYPQVFGSVLVQSPGVWPRFVTWDVLTSSPGPMDSRFSTREFLMDKVFGGEDDYNEKNICHIAEERVKNSGVLKAHRPKIRYACVCGC